VTVTGIISAIIVGLIGALGRLVLPGRQAIPIWLTILIGIAAAIIGTLIANALDVGSTRGIDWIELLLQIALAAVGVALGRRQVRTRPTAPLTLFPAVQGDGHTPSGSEQLLHPDGPGAPSRHRPQLVVRP
jgi:uncharacterized membrane protein YeaQ/YmgE (transglycosylase-associated protein family)